MIVNERRRERLKQRHKAIWLPVLLMFMVVPLTAAATGTFRVNQTTTGPAVQQVIKPDKPINCEDFAAHLDHAIIRWRKLKGTHFIMIARLGTGEQDRKLIRARFDYVEDYIQRKDVEYVFAEGSPVEGYGRMEVYVGGRLYMSIPSEKGSNRLCWGDLGE